MRVKIDRAAGLFAAIMFIVSGSWSSVVHAYYDCGSLENAFGPYDYREHKHGTFQLQLVESAHFTKNVENHISGKGGGRGRQGAMSDLDYTLRAFPNHHRALYSVSLFEIKYKIPRSDRYYSLDCYFDRAMRFAPTDGVVRLIYGIYYQKIENYEEALKRYKEALQLMPDSSEAHYNLGLLYLKLKDNKQAKYHAIQAYELGFPLPGLKNKLRALGLWDNGK